MLSQCLEYKLTEKLSKICMFVHRKKYSLHRQIKISKFSLLLTMKIVLNSKKKKLLKLILHKKIQLS